MQLKIHWVWFALKYISNYCLILNAADTRNKNFSKNYFWCFELSVFRIKPKLQISFPVNYSKNLSDVTYVLQNQSDVQMVDLLHFYVDLQPIKRKLKKNPICSTLLEIFFSGYPTSNLSLLEQFWWVLPLDTSFQYHIWLFTSIFKSNWIWLNDPETFFDSSVKVSACHVLNDIR